MTRLQTEFSFKANPNFLSQIQECEPKQKHIPIAVVLHQSDLERGMVRVRDVETRVEKEVEISGLVEYLKKEPKLNAWPTIEYLQEDYALVVAWFSSLKLTFSVITTNYICP